MPYFAQAVCEFTADQVADTDASYGAFSSCAHSHPNHQDLNGLLILVAISIRTTAQITVFFDTWQISF